MRFREVRISNDTRRAMQVAAAAAYPEECCGLLIGKIEGEMVATVRAVATPNVAEGSRHNRYRVEPLSMVRADEEARAIDMDIVGVYHSHPDHAAAPSAEDAARAWENFVYLIVPVKGGLAQTARAWQFEGGSFRELKVSLCKVDQR